MGVAFGGTGASTLTGLVLGNGTGAFTTITDSSANWDTAYGWGNHAGLYDVLGQATSTLASHTTTYNHANYDTAYGWGNHATAGYFPLSTWFATTSAPQLTTLSGLTSIGSASATTTILGGFNAHNTLYVDASTNNVGIGTTSPAQKLDVAGGANLAGTLTVANSAEKIVNGNFSSALGAEWNIDSGIGSIVGGQFLETATALNTTQYSYQFISGLVIGARYKFTVNYIGKTSDYAYLFVGTATSRLGSGYSSYADLRSNTGMTAGVQTVYFTATASTFSVHLGLYGAIGSTATWDSVSLVEMGNVVSSGILTVADTATSTFAGGLTVGTSQFVVQQATGNVGIGTTTPNATLNVVGSGFTGIVAGRRTDAPTVSGLFGLDSSSGTIYLQNDTNNLRLYTGATTGGTVGTERLTILGASGNVGIGTTTPTELLSISGATTNVIARLTNTNASGYSGYNLYNEAGVNVSTFAHSNTTAGTLAESTWIGTRNAESFHIVTNGTTPRLTVTSAGNVGIGTTTPAANLHIYAGTGSAIERIDSLAGNAYLYLRAVNTGNSYLLFGDQADDDIGYLDYDHDDNSLRFATNATANRMILTSAGYLGLGTTTPAVGLSIQGASSYGLLHLVGSTANSESSLQFKSADDTDTLSWVIGKNIGLTSDAFSVWHNSSNRLTITSAGNVGIGTTTPTDILHIASALPKLYISDTNSAANAKHWFMENDAGVLSFGTTSDALVVSGSRAMRISNLGNVTIGNASAVSTTAKFSVYVTATVWGGVSGSASGAWAQSSDLNLKTNITDLSLESPLQKLLGLRPVRYDWKSDPITGAGKHIGFIAQEVDMLFPELVATGSDGLKSLSYAEFAPILAGAIQEQQQEIKILKSQLSSSTLAVSDTPIISNHFDSLSAQSAAIFYGTITVKGEAGFESKVVFKNDAEFQGHITVDQDTAGTIMIPQGESTVKITFKKPYELMPRIVANLQSSGTPVFMPYLIADKSTIGFNIILENPAPSDLYFDWIALATKDVDGQVRPSAPEGAANGGQVAGEVEIVEPPALDISTLTPFYEAEQPVEEIAEDITPVAVTEDVTVTPSDPIINNLVQELPAELAPESPSVSEPVIEPAAQAETIVN